MLNKATTLLLTVFFRMEIQMACKTHSIHTVHTIFAMLAFIVIWKLSKEGLQLDRAGFLSLLDSSFRTFMKVKYMTSK